MHQRDTDPLRRSQRGRAHRAVHGKPEEGVTEPVHLPIGGPPSPNRGGLHRLLQRRSASSGNRGHSGMWHGPAEGDPSCDRGRPDQVRGTPGARRPTPRLSARNLAQVHLQVRRLVPKRAWSFLVTPPVPDSDTDWARSVSLGRQMIPEESGRGTHVPPCAIKNAPRILADGVLAEHGGWFVIPASRRMAGLRGPVRSRQGRS